MLSARWPAMSFSSVTVLKDSLAATLTSSSSSCHVGVAAGRSTVICIVFPSEEPADLPSRHTSILTIAEFYRDVQSEPTYNWREVPDAERMVPIAQAATEFGLSERTL